MTATDPDRGTPATGADGIGSGTDTAASINSRPSSATPSIGADGTSSGSNTGAVASPRPAVTTTAGADAAPEIGADGTGSGRLVTGLFNDRHSAESAYRSLSARGYGRDDVNLVMSDEARARHFGPASGGGTTTELGSKAAEGAAVGGALGGGLGAVLAAVAAVGTSLVLPGLGLVVAGPLAAALAGAGAGAATGGIIGALMGGGIPRERVAHYEEGLKQGGILMAVRPRSDEDAAWVENDWRANRGEHVYR